MVDYSVVSGSPMMGVEVGDGCANMLPLAARHDARVGRRSCAAEFGGSTVMQERPRVAAVTFLWQGCLKRVSNEGGVEIC